MSKKTISIPLIIIGALFAISQGASILNFTNLESTAFQDKFSSIHFMAPGNNFGGSMLRLPNKSISPITLTIQSGNHTKICSKQLRGIYFNGQRGKRLRPIDQETLELLKNQNSSYDNLTVSGGRYTTCSGNIYGIYGAITYIRGGKTSYLIAGTRIDFGENKVLPYLANNFQYFDNKLPLGYIYDSNGGIGYVGGMLTGHAELISFLNSGGTIQSGFVYSGNTIVSNNNNRSTTIQTGDIGMETMRNLIIQGSVGLSKSIDAEERTSLLGNLNNKTIVYNGSDINSSTLINTAKQKAQILCKGKAPYQNTTLGQTTEKIVCIKNQDITVNLEDNFYQDKTIIVENGNAILEGGMNQNSPTLDIFVNKGILYIPTNISEQNFSIEGFPTSDTGFSAGLYLKGNFIINGLIIGGSPGNETGIAHKLHIEGKITTLNTPLVTSEQRESQIEDLLGPGFSNYINLQNLMTWTCGFGGTGSDNTPCKTGIPISSTPLVILNGNYPSNLLQ